MSAPSLKGQPWLEAPSTRAVLDALEAAGGADCARFVGGSVRNALLGQPVDDIDIATQLTPDQVVRALKQAGLKAVPTGIDHGTITAVSDHRPYEITTLRRDVSTDGRRATVAFTTDWAEDAARRDFGMNALYADADGRIHDPTGRGLDDVAARRIVFVGDPERRIREDYLRILRFFRFYAWYGRGAPDPAGMAASAALAEGVTTLSAERVSKELLKLLAAPDPRAAVQAMAQAGVLRRLLPDAVGLAMFEAMCAVSDDALLRLSTLSPDDAQAVRRIATGLRLSNAQKDRLVRSVAAEPPVTLDMTPQAVRAAIYRLSSETVRDRLLRQWAMAGVEPGRAQAEELLAIVDSWRPPVMPVTGRDLAARGVASGPEVGRILKAFEAGWIGDDFPSDGHAARLDALIQSPPG